eukprot:4701967-Pyramimonas_sp.AAC.1
MEDVFNSARVEMRSAALMEERHRHGEFLHVPMDATIRRMSKARQTIGLHKQCATLHPCWTWTPSAAS